MYLHHNLLLTPGPTPVPKEIENAINSPLLGHRSKDFETLADQAFKAMKPIFGTENDVLILTSSGTSALEASMLNIVNPDDHFVIIVSGAFGNRYKQIAETYYEHVHVYDVEWGQAVDVNAFKSYLESLDVEITAVFTQFCETSTTVLHPVKALGQAIKDFNDSIYFVVDGVSCIGAVDINMADSQIDVLVSGSQKAIMLPPGIAFVAYNDRAKARFNDVTTPRFYLNLDKYIKSQDKSSTPFTPSVSLFQAVIKYAEIVEREGFSKTIARHNTIKDAGRKALTALDLPLLVEDAYASPTVTAFIPKDKDELNFIKNELKSRFNITIAGGQGKLKGEILRVGHMGKVNPFDILTFVGALEILLTEFRNTSYLGKGTQSYLEVIQNDL
ncbi:pyridoxal-phosphate-dependent aminotransferase family protein [Staphylococcus massiliensis]|uniref:Phosphoserine aminotransferase n=1 Tax=Staphylococcus massiliensis S46 TaxID=1229783 RepID=K9AVV4_9STAP|nr:alanine--glyoxylate aminotransferase family protein [Staphylococcus massiliensis]EKU50231.1 phosphoserine aminotransferase [Staphylococcus massiliensis S46]